MIMKHEKLHYAWLRFVAICERHCVAPSIALEVDGIKSAITEEDWSAVEEMILENF